MLVLLLGDSLLSLKECLSVLVELELSDQDVAGVNGDLGLLSVGLLSDDLFDVEAPLLSVDSLDLALTTLAASAHDLHGVTLADGDCAHVVLSAEFLVQVAAHDLSSD